MINVERIVNLKNLPRTGWLLSGVPQAIAEDVAGHVFEVLVNTYIICKELIKAGVAVDLSKALTLALFHDVEEAVIGDLVRYLKESVGGLNNLKLNLISGLGLNDEVKLFEEYLKLTSIEGIIVKISDSLATVNQGCRYLDAGYSGVEPVISSTLKSIEEILDVKIASQSVKELISDVVRYLTFCKSPNRFEDHPH